MQWGMLTFNSCGRFNGRRPGLAKVTAGVNARSIKTIHFWAVKIDSRRIPNGSYQQYTVTTTRYCRGSWQDKWSRTWDRCRSHVCCEAATDSARIWSDSLHLLCLPIANKLCSIFSLVFGRLHFAYLNHIVEFFFVWFHFQTCSNLRECHRLPIASRCNDLR